MPVQAINNRLILIDIIVDLVVCAVVSKIVIPALSTCAAHHLAALIGLALGPKLGNLCLQAINSSVRMEFPNPVWQAFKTLKVAKVQK